jgi:S-adenosylmethionine:tRNA ribosyltransferase-isomerase
LGKGCGEGGDGFGGGYLVSLPDLFGGDGKAFFDYLEEWGRTPLPPYIKRSHNGGSGGDVLGSVGEVGGIDSLEGLDRERYQTVYAEPPGSVAAPTAGLHFGVGAIERLKGMGVEFARVTLHVGPGTFLPIKSSRLEDHTMHAEAYEISTDAAEAVNRAKGEGRRVVAVGTTTVRTLESAADEDGTVKGGRDVTSLFIVPGHRFRMVDALLTNFHLPRSTLIVMVSAFCEASGVSGWELILKAYGEAIERGYRFYSYGDAMLIV